MSGTAVAPAAVEDARCALRWVYRNAKQFHLDTDRIIVTGHSAGGHLALTTGMLLDSDGLDNDCPADPEMGEPPLKVAAIVDWYGPTDLPDLLAGPNRKTYAVAWFGGSMDRDAEARRVSPIQYVRGGMPPVFIVHGDQDPTVPYTQSLRLHELLDGRHVTNQLYTIHGGKHGFFGAKNDIAAYRAMWDFLEANIPSLPKRVPTNTVPPQ
jgi:acetyl esterase/lipase